MKEEYLRVGQLLAPHINNPLLDVRVHLDRVGGAVAHPQSPSDHAVRHSPDPFVARWRVCRGNPLWLPLIGCGRRWADTGARPYERRADDATVLEAVANHRLRLLDKERSFVGTHILELGGQADCPVHVLADLAGEPGWARSLLDRIIEKNLVMLENILTAREIDGVLLGSDWGTQRDLIMAPDTWEEMIRPGEQREYDLVHSYGKEVWVHSCGNVEKIIPSLIEMGLDVLNPIQPEAMDIQKVKERYGDRLAFWGGISTQQVLPFGTPQEVKAETRRVREIMSKGGGYILAPAQEIQGDVPAGNIVALIEAAKEK